MRLLSETPFASIGQRWQSSAAENLVFEAEDPVLKEPCF
jgi:hypothetical protein